MTLYVSNKNPILKILININLGTFKKQSVRPLSLTINQL